MASPGQAQAPRTEPPVALTQDEYDEQLHRFKTERIRLHRELSAAERADNLERQQSLLNDLVVVCQTLDDMSCEAQYTAKLDEVLEKIKARNEKEKERRLREEERREKRQRAEVLVQQGTDQMARGQLDEARRLLTEAQKLDPAVPGLATILQRLDAIGRDAQWRRIVSWSLGGATAAGGLGALLLWLRKRRPSAKLEMVLGPEPGELVALDKPTLLVGALAGEVDWCIVDPSRRISRRHCEIAKSGRHYFLTDLSTNGTLLNGRAVPPGEAVLLHRGDRIQLSEDIVLRLRR